MPSRRQELDRVAVPRSQQAEVPTIEGRQLRFIQSLDDRQDSCVDEPDVGIGISVAKVADAHVIGSCEIGDDVGAGLDVREERDEHTRMQQLMDPVVDFDENWRRDHERFVSGLDQRSTGSMIGIGAVEGCVQGSRVEDQRHGRGSGRSSLLRLAVSDDPDAPIPRLRGLGARRSTFSSMASRMIVAIDTPRSAAIRRRRRRVSSGRDNVVRSMVT